MRGETFAEVRAPDPSGRWSALAANAALVILATSTIFVPLHILHPLGMIAFLQEHHAEARDWFQNAKFGMFIHWGVYSVAGRGEWVMENEKIPITEYEKFAPQFNPTGFSAAGIVSLAKAAGMR